MADQPPRVFVSYSDDSPQHAARVLELAQWLRSAGVDAHIDQFEESPEEGWPRWIYTQVRESEFVLIVCTAAYLERCEGEVPRGRQPERAVKFESHLTLQEIHDAEGRNRKFIPLVFGDVDIGECVPLPLRSATHYRLPDQRDDLYRRLSDQPKIRPVPLGALRTYDDDSHDLLPAVKSPSKSKSKSASESLSTVSVSDEPPPKRRKRAWSSKQVQRLLTVGAFGLAFLTTALFINNALTDNDDPGGGGSCRIELTDSNGGAIGNNGHVTLELPAGNEIEFSIEDGNTLRFKCPTVAVQARVRVEDATTNASMTEAETDAPEPEMQRFHALESTFTVQPSLAVQTVQLGLPPNEITQAEPPEAQPQPELEPQPIGSNAPSSEATGGSNELGSSPGQANQGDSKPPARPRIKIELSLTPSNPTLERDLRAKLPQLEACVPDGLKSPAQISCKIQQDAANTIVNITVDDAALRKQDHKVADCVQREIGSWNLGKTEYDPAGAVSRATIKFGPR